MDESAREHAFEHGLASSRLRQGKVLSRMSVLMRRDPRATLSNPFSQAVAAGIAAHGRDSRLTRQHRYGREARHHTTSRRLPLCRLLTIVAMVIKAATLGPRERLLPDKRM